MVHSFLTFLQPVSFYPVTWILKLQIDQDIFFICQITSIEGEPVCLLFLKLGAPLFSMIPRNIVMADGEQPETDQMDQKHLRQSNCPYPFKGHHQDASLETPYLGLH